MKESRRNITHDEGNQRSGERGGGGREGEVTPPSTKVTLLCPTGASLAPCLHFVLISYTEDAMAGGT